MGFFDKLKDLRDEINKIEASVYKGNQSLLEVYERNAKLEAEIAARTLELETANKQMLTLQHIWDMMNSSRPLSSVLNAITKSLQGELGYLHSCIVKKMVDKGGEYLLMVASSGELFGNTFLKYYNCTPLEYRFNIPVLDGLVNAIDKNEIYQSTELVDLINGVSPEMPIENIEEAIAYTETKSYIMIPLTYKNTHFGSLIVFSSREDATPNEINFLGLFAKQIELAITIADLFEVVKSQAVTDSMTGLYNRRYFEEFIQKETVRSKRHNQKFTVIGIDLDHLKRINDTYGHNYGDIAIKALAEVLKSSCRSIDIAARMGGEEFNVILSGVDSQGGLIFAERIRRTVESINLEKVGKITASIGVATYKEHSEDIDELLELVDHAMYESKRNGRNRVTIAKPISDTSWQEVAIDTFVDILSKHRIPIDGRTSRLLNKKLQEMNINNDMLYQVSDAVVSTYNPDNEAGITKKKVLFATLLAKRYDLPKENIDRLKIAILLYDIGNTMLPKEILSKKEKLTNEDRETIKKHPILAAKEILEPISPMSDIIPIIEKHHENWNGTGYPNKLSGENIPIESQIILIVDSFFALMENRPYRQALSKDKAVEMIISEAGTKWSERLAEEFKAVIKEDWVD